MKTHAATANFARVRACLLLLSFMTGAAAPALAAGAQNILRAVLGEAASFSTK